MDQEIFRMERVTYQEKGVTFLEDFNLQINQGEIMGLLPINAHGLPAFLNLLEMNLPLHDGYVFYAGEQVNSWKGARKPRNRISVIGAQKRLVDVLDVTDNIFVLREGFRQELLNTRILKSQLMPFLKDIGMDLPLDVPVNRLSVFERVVLELLREVVLGHRLIVLNEIGALISYEELSKFHEILRHYVQKGFSFLYVCPHYEEVERVCGRIAMLSHGRILKIVQKGKMTDEFIKLCTVEYEQMVRYRLEKQKKISGDTVLRISGLGREYVQSFSMEVSKGECVALQIKDNSCFMEMQEMLLGNIEPESGRVWVREKESALFGNPGIAVIKELATRTMIFPELTYMENLCIYFSARVPSVWSSRKIQKSIRQEYGPVLGQDVFYKEMEELSEKQKYQLIYTRILLAKPAVVFCIQPFKGADLSHRMFIWKMLEMLLNHGIAVVILSLSLSDSLSLADRLILMDKGYQKEIYRRDFASVTEVVPWRYLYRELK